MKDDDTNHIVANEVKHEKDVVPPSEEPTHIVTEDGVLAEPQKTEEPTIEITAIETQLTITDTVHAEHQDGIPNHKDTSTNDTSTVTEAKATYVQEAPAATHPTEPSSSTLESANDASTDAATSSATSTVSIANPPASNSSPSSKGRTNTAVQFAAVPADKPFSLNSSAGIDEDSTGSDSEEVSRRKGKRKERGYSKVITEHKKNLLGETIYKGHPSWVLMLNIQTGIRNAVGKSTHQSRSFHHSRSTLSQSHSQPQPPPSPQSSPLPASNSQPIARDSPVMTPPTLKLGPDGILGPDQFEKLEEFYASPRVLQFPSAGSSQTIPHQTGPFKFKDYCPHAFRFLRHRFGIDQADYMVSLCNTQKNGENALRELPTPGKSGSLFFFSHDMRFILKTIPKSEAKLLRLLLPSYVEHIANDENTLLPKFFGLHRVKPHKGRQVRFVVMSNVFQTKKKIHERYDLKGSTLGRAASEDEKKKDTVTYKDLDFRERKMKIQIGPERRTALLEQLRRDCKFLGQLNIMDYSLLIGVHYEDRDNDRIGPPSPLPPALAVRTSGSTPPEYFTSIFQANDGGMKGIDENGNPTGAYYYMGIIDILMLYSVRKKFEHTYKTLRYKKEGEEISSISPPEYANRFYEFTAASIV